ncbi:MAG: flavodoxin-dependent (E)-4-hydroxy-3-methylbut-2-enyl-diphosphate synthase [Clostridiales bacterium]|nr:flavodoxin-dependent (E)-4-hydroxy-3-methylbut-2-enyl-diphosphate synthase [Clostridiales bacterium]
MQRKITRRIMAGNLAIGGGADISVQSMCNTKTQNVEETLGQIEALCKAGCDIVRLAVPDNEAARVLPEIRKNCKIPLVADIHFDYKLAIAAAKAGFDKIRINPGNIGSEEKVRELARACQENGAAIRVGVNSGSIPSDLLREYGNTPKALCESALRHIRLLEKADFKDICVSLKSSDVSGTVEACRMMSGLTDYPLHLGITESGTPYSGLVKSSVGIGTLLMEGIGDTIRVSLTADPVEEVRAGIAILKAAGLRRCGVNIISCPTCGRTDIDLISLTEKVEALLSGIEKPITVAVMGCAVNGPGEAREADYGIAGGRGEGLLFKNGEIIKKVSEDELAPELLKMIQSDTL